MDETEDVKTTVLTNLPVTTEEVYTEHISSDDLAVFDNSDGNLTINTVQQVVEVVEPGEVVPEPGEVIVQQGELKHEDSDTEATTIYIMQIGEASEELEDGEYEEYELCADEEENKKMVDDDTEEEREDSLVDDPTYGEEEEEEQKRFVCNTCKRNFKTPAVS